MATTTCPATSEEDALLWSIGPLVVPCPDSAFELIDSLEQSLRLKNQSTRPLHLGRFLAYATLAAQQLRDDRQPDHVTLNRIEKALTELRRLFDAYSYEETETYQKEVEVRPAGIFRDAKRELRSFTRTVRKRRLDPELYRLHLNAIAPALERAENGMVSAILGEITVYCLTYAGHVSGAPNVDPHAMDNADRVSVAQVWLPVDKPVRGAYVVLVEGGNKPEMEVWLLDYPLQTPDSKIVVAYRIEKQGEGWSARPKL